MRLGLARSIVAVTVVVLAAARAHAQPRPAPPNASAPQGEGAAGPGDAPADSPPEVNEALARARPHFTRGVALVAQQAWAEALDAFLAAQREYDSPIVAFNIGYCQRALGQSVAALSTLRGFLGRELTGVAATRRAEAEDLVRELAARVARVRISVPPGLRAEAEVRLDGRAVALDPRGEASVVVDPGRHTVLVEHAGYERAFVDRDVRPGADEALSVVLRPLPARLVIRSNVRGASVRLDGVLAGRVPFNSQTGAGLRRLEVTAGGYIAQRGRLNLVPGVTTRLIIDLPREPLIAQLARQWWFWTIAGVVVTGVVVGVGVGTYYATRQPPPPPPFQGGTLDWVVMP